MLVAQTLTHRAWHAQMTVLWQFCFGTVEKVFFKLATCHMRWIGVWFGRSFRRLVSCLVNQSVDWYMPS